MEPVLVNIAAAPNFNPGANTKAPRGDHSVSGGKIIWDAKNKVCCRSHGAMLCVSDNRRLWRCIACGAGAYVLTWPPKPPAPKAPPPPPRSLIKILLLSRLGFKYVGRNIWRSEKHEARVYNKRINFGLRPYWRMRLKLLWRRHGWKLKFR